MIIYLALRLIIVILLSDMKILKSYFVVLNKLGQKLTPLPIINKTIGKKDLSFTMLREIQKKRFIFGLL